MKKTIILLFLLIIPLVFASKTETTMVLHLNDTFTLDGKTLTILRAANTGQLKVSVDGVQGLVKPGVNRSSNVNEMFIEVLNFTYIDVDYSEMILKVTVNDKCGDGNCSGSETSISCCKDCGCENNNNLRCINNICRTEECVLKWDCEDNNNCTIDACSTTLPRVCSYTPITQCVNNDTCCPSSCGPANDTDCITFVEEKVEEKPKSMKEELTEKAQEVLEQAKTVKSSVKEMPREKWKGFMIMGGVALLVIIIGFLFFGKKQAVF